MRNTYRRRILGMIATGLLLAASAPVSAATLNWDPTETGTATGGGSGSWDTTPGAPLPWFNSLIPGNVDWNNATPDSAVFGGVAGTVTLAEPISVGTMTFNVVGYTIDLNGNALNQSGTIGGTGIPDSTSVITNSSGTAATYTVTAADADGFARLTGNMNVTVNAAGTWIPMANNTFTGVLRLDGGVTLRADNGSTSTGSASGTIQLAGTNTTLNMSAPAIFDTYGRDIQMENNTVRLMSNGVRMITLTGQVSGGDLNLVGGQGSVILAGANTYTGATNITVAASSGASLILANNGALGSSTTINVGSGDAAMLGFMKNPTTGANITLGGGVTYNATGSIPNSGYGMLHNFSGENTWQGNVVLGSNTYRPLSVAADSSLTITGVLGPTADNKGISKLGEGTLILTGANMYGTSNVSEGSNGTIVAQGTLRLDFSQSGAVDSNIINAGTPPSGTFSITSNRSSQLVLSGGTLEVVGSAGETNSQAFSNRSVHGFTIDPGESRVVAVQNGATSLTINVGRLMANSTGDNAGVGTNAGGRHIGGTVDFTLPTTGSIILGTAAAGSAGATNTILTTNGSAFATVGGNDWAGIDASRNIVGLTTLGGYTANTATTLSGNADMSAGVDTALAASASVTSLRFHNSGTRSIDLGGNTLTTGGILVTANGNGPTSISNGTLRGEVGAITNRQDLVIIQRNTASPMTIGATIADNTTATALTKAGAGTLDLTSGNGYTGPTVVTGGVLKLSHASALGGGNLVLKGGVIGLTAASGDFTRAIGTTAGTVRWYTNESINDIGTGASTDPTTGGSGGFAAYGGTRNVNIGGAGVALRWGENSAPGTGFQESRQFVRNLFSLILGADDADGTVNFVNPINLNHSNSLTYVERTIDVRNGSADVDGIMAGALSSNEGGIIKTGAGTLALATTNTYWGDTTINAGRLLINGSTHANSRVFVNSGGTLGGTGTANGVVTVATGGTLSPGASPGILNTGSETWASDGNYNWQVYDATGAAGTGYDKVSITGSLTINSGFNLNLWSLSAVTPDVSGDALNFNNAVAQSWTIASTTTGITGNEDLVDIFASANNGAAGFSNDLNGGTFSLDIVGNDLVLNFTPDETSEPVSVISLVSGAGTGTNLADDTDASENPGSATPGQVRVDGSNGAYVSEIDGLTSNLNAGHAVIDAIGNDPLDGDVFVMLWLQDDNSSENQTDDRDALRTALAADGGSTYELLDGSDPQWTALQASYGGFDTLVRFFDPAFALSTGAFNWDFAAHTDVVVDQIAVVPEPASFALLALGGGLVLSRSRRTKRI
jgi:fibronectin-binding autotransporter adhesin